MEEGTSLVWRKAAEGSNPAKFAEYLLLTQSLRTGQICSLNGGFVISKTSI